MLCPQPPIRPFSFDRQIVLLVCVFAIVLLCPLPTQAQSQSIQHTGNAIGKALRTDLKVNPLTQALEMQIPLGPSAYPQRGGGDDAVSIAYSSKVWRMAYSGTAMAINPITHQPYPVKTLVAAQFGEHTRSGWTFSLNPPYVDADPHQENYDYSGTPISTCVSGNGSSCCYIDRVRIIMGDGSTHEFRSTDQPICYTTSGGVTPTPPDDLYSVDGSRMHYRRTDNTLFLPDGSFWKLTDGSYFDRNGNRLISTSGDTLGRTLNNPLADGSTDYSTTEPGVGGNVSYSYHWRSLSNALTTSPGTWRFSSYGCIGSACDGDFLFTSDSNPVPTMVVNGPNYFNPVVLYQIVLPTGQAYTFTYNVYGEIDKVVYPTGAYERFQYSTVDFNTVGSFVYSEGGRGVTDRWVSATGNASDEQHWTYPGSYNNGYLTAGEMAPDLTTTTRVLWAGTLGGMPWSYSDSRGRMPIEESNWSAPDANGNRQMLRRKLTQWDKTGANWSGNGPFFVENASRNPRVAKEVEIVLDTGTSNALAKTTVHNYDLTYEFSIGAIETSVTEYNWISIDQNTAQTAAIGSISAGTTILRTQETTNLLLDTNITQSVRDAYRTRNLVSLLTSSRIKDGAGNIVAQSSASYDEYSLMNPGSVASWTDPQTIYRGNPTTTGQWLNTTNSYLQAHASYDQFGNTRTTTDPKGNQSSVDYSSVYQYAYPTTTTTAVPDPNGTYGSNVALSSATNFDFNTGNALSSTDANGIISTAEFNDSLNRPTRMVNASGNTAQNQSPITYDDPNHLVTGKSDLTAFNDNGLKAETVYDGLRRTIESRKYESSTNYAVVQTQYDSMGRAYMTSNPFRPMAPYCETAVWTTTGFDALGRATSVTTPDGAVMTTAYAASTSGSLGTTVLVRDQDGKERISQTNALGQLTDVWEITGADQVTENITFPGHPEVTAGYHTSYSYDVLGNLLSVNQGDQTRTFVYDSLKRLTSATNPESGAISYQYDANGNLTVKTDARGVSAHCGYDALNRAVHRWYNSSSSPTDTINNNPALPSSVAASAEVKLYYDSAPLPSGAPTLDRGYATGRLVAVTYGAGSSGTYRGYDAMGRVVRQYQQTDSVNYLTEATYYASGSIQNETYPSIPGYSDRRVVSYTSDGAGRLASLNSNSTTYAPSASVSNIGYASHGALKTQTYGNTLAHAIDYNYRLQPIEIKLGTSGNPTSILDLTYSYGTTNNNGNVQSIGYTGGGLSYTQSFGYDQLNRLTTSNENNGTSWSQTNRYDRYGNRWIDLGGGNQSLYFNSPTNNRISGWSYDSAGNLLNDAAHSYVFDAENKISKVDAASAYVYDGDGQRIRKLVGENLRFIYDIGGKEIAEFDGSNGNLKKEYIYGVSGLVATIEPTSLNGNGTLYTTSDNLGTPRVVTNASATVVSRHDYKPFGEEIAVGVGGRTPGMGFGVADGQRKQFTQKERDVETGLDYFGARYYSSAQGRFTGADNIVYSKTVDPQTFNQYAYCRNGPLSRIDVDGHNWFLVHHKKGDAWEWHDGSKYTVPDTGKKLKSRYTNLIVITLTTNMTYSGANKGTTTIYGKGFNDVKAQDTYTFAGGYGANNGPPKAGEYFINLAKVGRANQASSLKDGSLAHFHDGFQYVPQRTPQGHEPQWSWGRMRANLSRAAWVDGEPVFREGNGTTRYLHGHDNSFGVFGRDGTLGCVATPNEHVLNYLSQSIGNSQVHPQIPVSVKAPQ